MYEMNVINHPMFGEVKIAVGINIILYNAKDCAKALGYKDTSKVIKRFVDKSHMTKLTKKDFRVDKMSTLKINNFGAVFITEAGLYDLILDSKMPAAKEFRKWVTEEVIPSIKRTGKYDINSTHKDRRVKIEEIFDFDKAFKISTNTSITKLSIIDKTLKGVEWNRFCNLFNKVYGTNIRALATNYATRNNLKKKPTPRQILDILDKKEEALLVFEILHLLAFNSLNKKRLERLSKIIDEFKSLFTEEVLDQTADKAKKFIAENPDFAIDLDAKK